MSSQKKISEQLSVAYSKARILVNSILPTLLEFIDNGAIEESNRAIRNITDKYKTGFIDVYSLFVDIDGKPIKEYFSPDGLHLSAIGYEIWSDAIGKLISA